MASQDIELLHPTFFDSEAGITMLDRATSLAKRILRENGMSDFSTTQDHASYWKGYIIFEYFNIEEPDAKYGGGATLVVRKKDLVGGMVYCSFDWLEQDIDLVLANIPKAFSAFDSKSTE